MEDERVYYVVDKHFLHGGRRCFALVINALVLEMNMLKTRVQT